MSEGVGGKIGGGGPGHFGVGIPGGDPTTSGNAGPGKVNHGPGQDNSPRAGDVPAAPTRGAHGHAPPGQEKTAARAQDLQQLGQSVRERVTARLDHAGQGHGNDAPPRAHNNAPPEIAAKHGHQSDNGPARLNQQPPSHGQQDAPRGDNLTHQQHNVRPEGSHGLPAQTHGNAHGQARASGDTGADARALAATAGQYLRDQVRGEELPPGLRRVLDAAADHLGKDFARALDRAAEPGGDKTAKLIDYALARAGRETGRALGEANRGGNHAERTVGAAVKDLGHATQLDKLFRQLEKSGGEAPVRRAEQTLARLLYAEQPTRRGGQDHARNGGIGAGHTRENALARGNELPHAYASPAAPPRPDEVLRDLRAGAFLPREASHNPFPLTGRARVVTEMMELSRTLDHLERAAQTLATNAREGKALDADALGSLLSTYAPASENNSTEGGLTAGKMPADALDELLSALLPALPGRAARLELLRLAAALEGSLFDAQGHVLVNKDGTPLRLDQLLWSGSLGVALGGLFGNEAEAVPLSPLLIYGFDTLYSLIGFDGRTLNPPQFAAVQAQVNGSEMEYVFGQEPLSEGWARALVERLKDSCLSDHNALGEMLEEAMAEGRFHTLLVGGQVEEGEPVRESFEVTKLIPGFAADAAVPAPA